MIKKLFIMQAMHISLKLKSQERFILKQKYKYILLLRQPNENKAATVLR
jgi:hypothetical protein